MHMAFHFTYHSNIVNNNLFQQLIVFMFYEQFLIKNAIITRISTSYEFDHAHIIYHMEMS